MSSEHTFTFTISGTFTAATRQEAFDAWVEALHAPAFVEDGTVTAEELS